MIVIVYVFLYLFIGALVVNGIMVWEDIKNISKKPDMIDKILYTLAWPIFIVFWLWEISFWKKIWNLISWPFKWPFKLQEWIMRELLVPRENTLKRS